VQLIKLIKYELETTYCDTVDFVKAKLNQLNLCDLTVTPILTWDGATLTSYLIQTKGNLEGSFSSYNRINIIIKQIFKIQSINPKQPY
jgi:hypothetical protein